MSAPESRLKQVFLTAANVSARAQEKYKNKSLEETVAGVVSAADITLGQLKKYEADAGMRILENDQLIIPATPGAASMLGGVLFILKGRGGEAAFEAPETTWAVERRAARLAERVKRKAAAIKEAEEAAGRKAERAAQTAEAREAARQARVAEKEAEKAAKKDVAEQAKSLKKTQYAASLEELREEFFEVCGITDASAYREEDGSFMPLHRILGKVAEVLRQNTGLNHEEIAESFNPPKQHAYVTNRLAGQVTLDKAFVDHFAAAVKPLLEVGLENSWLDSATKMPRALEDIIVERAGVTHAWLGGKKGTEAFLHSIEASGLPDMAIGPMIGHSPVWISANTNFPPSAVAAAAEAIGPYARKEKEWTGLLEVTDPEYVENHKACKAFLQQHLQSLVGIPLKEVDDFFANRPSVALGPIIKELRTSIKEVFLTQDDFGTVSQSEMDVLERNCFNPYCVKENGELSDAMQQRLDQIATVIGFHWKEYGIKPEALAEAKSIDQTKKKLGKKTS